jgi:tetratricopeptide (TPR) repeat protein
LPGWQKFYHELKDRNFEIVSVAEDTGGVKDAGPRITAASPEYTVLIDDKHLVTMLYDMVNVPTVVWINEQGRIVRPNETAYVDNRYKALHGLDADEYLAALRDWVDKGDKSRFSLSEDEVKRRLAPQDPNHALASAEFGLGEYLYKNGRGPDAIPHFKEAQRLNPESWNYKRQAWALSDAKRDYGTSFGEEVRKLNGKPYYAPRQLGEDKTKDTTEEKKQNN